MLCAYTNEAQISGERLQDHWSSGFSCTPFYHMHEMSDEFAICQI